MYYSLPFTDSEMGFGIDRSRLKEMTSEDFLDCLEHHRLLGPYNLVFLPILLVYVKRDDLKGKVDTYSKRIRDIMDKVNPLTLCNVEKAGL